MVEHKWRVLTNTTIGTFMASLDTSIVLISLPTIGRELPGADPATLLWVVLTYNLVTTTLLVSFGRFSDMFGRVRLYTMGFAIFTIGSLFASLSVNGAMLLSARVVQGVGAGFLFSNSTAILTDAFPVHERGRALGVNQVAALSGSMFGLVLGGILTAILGWRSIFWVNLPIGLVGTLWARIGLEELHPQESGAKIDWIGNLLFGIGLTTFLVGVTLGGLDGWFSPAILVLLVTGLSSLTGFVFYERVVKSPMFDLALLKIRTFLMGNLASLLSSLARGSFAFIMTFYFQGLLLDNALTAGILLLPLSLGFLVTGPVSGWLSDTKGARFLGTLGLVITAGGYFIMVDFPAYGSYAFLAVTMVLLGVGQGMFAAPNRAEVMSSVPPERRGISGAITSTFLNAGNLGSLALGFSILVSTVPLSTLTTIFAGQTPPTALDVGGFMSALHLIFYISLGLALLAALLNALRGHEARLEDPIPNPK
jgi:EmrB/QacA subfamily drug resistance transporter